MNKPISPAPLAPTEGESLTLAEIDREYTRRIADYARIGETPPWDTQAIGALLAASSLREQQVREALQGLLHSLPPQKEYTNPVLIEAQQLAIDAHNARVVAAASSLSIDLKPQPNV